MDLFQSDYYGPYLATDTAIESRIIINLVEEGIFNEANDEATVDESIFIQSEGITAPGAEVLLLDIMSCAGPIHIIDRVLLPTLPNGSVIDLESPDADYTVAPIVEVSPISLLHRVPLVMSVSIVTV